MEELGTMEMETHGDVVVMSLLGEWDISNAPAVRHMVQGPVESGQGLVVSVARTEFIDSSVIRTLFDLHTQLGEKFVLHIATATIVRRAIEVTGLAEAVTCTGSMDEAIELARPEGAGSG